MFEAAVTALAISTAVAGLFFFALLAGFYIRYRVSGAAPTSTAAFATAVVECVILGSALFASLLGGFIGHYLGGPAGAGFVLLIGFPIGALAALGYPAPVGKLIVGMLVRP